MMKVFVSGASGLVGSNVLKHFQQQQINVVGSYFSYATEGCVYYNTLQPNHSDNFDITSFAPNVIVHCGAMTHVDACETEPQESYDKTVQSTKNLLEIAKHCNAKLVYIGTDYVFDGSAGPYLETDAVHPLSTYAAHKLEAEQLVQQHSSANLVLRITNVYGDEQRNKNFIARIIQQAQAHQPLTLKLPYDQYATPVCAWDVARAMLLLLQDNKCGIYHIASTDWMNRVDLALTVLKYFPKAQYDLLPCSTAELAQAAARPLRGGLHKIKFSSEYKEFRFTTVDEYVSAQAAQHI
jgi:dTDP-4-dehydrorhamnose reductase